MTPLIVSAYNLPAAWERSIEALLAHGRPTPTQYDAEGEPPSLEAVMIMTVLNPMGEPRAHRNIPEGLDGLR
jgi:hypothetical protein